MKITMILIALALLSGCATITRGTTDAFVIESTPAGAAAHLSTGMTCTTPCTLELKRKTAFTVEITKEGYETVNANIVSTVDGAGGAGMAGNVIFGGLIGVVVDGNSGAMKSHKPNPLVVTLVKVGKEEEEVITETADLSNTVF